MPRRHESRDVCWQCGLELRQAAQRAACLVRRLLALVPPLEQPRVRQQLRRRGSLVRLDARRGHEEIDRGRARPPAILGARQLRLHCGRTRCACCGVGRGRHRPREAPRRRRAGLRPRRPMRRLCERGGLGCPRPCHRRRLRRFRHGRSLRRKRVGRRLPEQHVQNDAAKAVHVRGRATEPAARGEECAPLGRHAAIGASALQHEPRRALGRVGQVHGARRTVVDQLEPRRRRAALP
mmetsp:Transcript_14301/g.36288  ORF Transcript_14301/g.36288 Transcript_14301/m.36288 type:complete len:237 (-) Transcript_14301:276-986(-)